MLGIQKNLFSMHILFNYANHLTLQIPRDKVYENLIHIALLIHLSLGKKLLFKPLNNFNFFPLNVLVFFFFLFWKNRNKLILLASHKQSPPIVPSMRRQATGGNGQYSIKPFNSSIPTPRASFSPPKQWSSLEKICPKDIQDKATKRQKHTG